MAADPPAFERRALAWGVYGLVGYFGYLEALLGPVMPFIRAEQDLGYTVASLHFAAFAAGGVVAGGVADRLTARSGRQRKPERDRARLARQRRAPPRGAARALRDPQGPPSGSATRRRPRPRQQAPDGLLDLFCGRLPRCCSGVVHRVLGRDLSGGRRGPLGPGRGRSNGALLRSDARGPL